MGGTDFNPFADPTAQFTRQALRELERLLDRAIRQDPPRTGRQWREHRPGFRLTCAACRAPDVRCWVGSYTQGRAGCDPLVAFHIRSSAPICARCASVVQRHERPFPIHGRHADLPHVPV